MAKTNRTIAKLKNLYTEFGHEYTPYSAKEIKELQKTITLPKTLEEYYKKIGSLENEQIRFPMYIVKPSDLQELMNILCLHTKCKAISPLRLKKVI